MKMLQVEIIHNGEYRRLAIPEQQLYSHLVKYNKNQKTVKVYGENNVQIEILDK